MIQIVLENLDTIQNDYQKKVIEAALKNKLFDKIYYTYAPKKKSYFVFFNSGSAYGYNEEIKIMAHLLTYHKVCCASMNFKKESYFDDFFKNYLNERFEKNQEKSKLSLEKNINFCFDLTLVPRGGKQFSGLIEKNNQYIYVSYLHVLNNEICAWQENVQKLLDQGYKVVAWANLPRTPLEDFTYYSSISYDDLKVLLERIKVNTLTNIKYLPLSIILGSNEIKLKLLEEYPEQKDIINYWYRKNLNE